MKLSKKILINASLIIVFASFFQLGESDNWDHCENEYYFGDGNTFIAFHCVEYPQTILTALNDTAGVEVAEFYGGTLITVDMDIIVLEPQEMIDTLDAYYYQHKSNQQRVIPFPGYKAPLCVQDWYTGEPRSIYVLDTEIYAVDDGKC